MFRCMRVLSLLALLFMLGSPAAAQAARNPARAADSAVPRLVVLEGFYAPG